VLIRTASFFEKLNLYFIRLDVIWVRFSFHYDGLQIKMLKILMISLLSVFRERMLRFVHLQISWFCFNLSSLLLHRFYSVWYLHAWFSNATVTYSRIPNRVHTVSKPYRPRFTRVDQHHNPCQFLRISWLRYGGKTFCVMFKIFCKDFISVLISVLNRFEPRRPAG
jgi:hypothetical protein